MAFLGSLPAPGGTEEHGGASAASSTTSRNPGPSPGGEGFSFSATDRIAHGGPRAMTIAKGDPADRQSARATRRVAGRRQARATCPTTGTAEAAAVERARKGDAPRGARPQADPDRGRRPVRGAAPPGRRRLLRLPGRRHPAALRRPRRLPRAAPRPGPPRAGRRPRGRRLRPRHRPGRRVHGHVRPRRHQPRHRASARRCSTPCRWSRSPATCPAR